MEIPSKKKRDRPSFDDEEEEEGEVGFDEGVLRSLYGDEDEGGGYFDFSSEEAQGDDDEGDEDIDLGDIELEPMAISSDEEFEFLPFTTLTAGGKAFEPVEKRRRPALSPEELLGLEEVEEMEDIEEMEEMEPFEPFEVSPEPIEISDVSEEPDGSLIVGEKKELYFYGVTFPIPVLYAPRLDKDVVKWINDTFTRESEKEVARCMLARWIYLVPPSNEERQARVPDDTGKMEILKIKPSGKKKWQDVPQKQSASGPKEAKKRGRSGKNIKYKGLLLWDPTLEFTEALSAMHQGPIGQKGPRVPLVGEGGASRPENVANLLRKMRAAAAKGNLVILDHTTIDRALYGTHITLHTTGGITINTGPGDAWRNKPLKTLFCGDEQFKFGKRHKFWNVTVEKGDMVKAGPPNIRISQLLLDDILTDPDLYSPLTGDARINFYKKRVKKLVEEVFARGRIDENYMERVRLWQSNDQCKEEREKIERKRETGEEKEKGEKEMGKKKKVAATKKARTETTTGAEKVTSELTREEAEIMRLINLRNENYDDLTKEQEKRFLDKFVNGYWNDFDSDYDDSEHFVEVNIRQRLIVPNIVEFVKDMGYTFPRHKVSLDNLEEIIEFITLLFPFYPGAPREHVALYIEDLYDLINYSSSDEDRLFILEQVKNRWTELQKVYASALRKSKEAQHMVEQERAALPPPPKAVAPVKKYIWDREKTERTQDGVTVHYHREDNPADAFYIVCRECGKDSVWPATESEAMHEKLAKLTENFTKYPNFIRLGYIGDRKTLVNCISLNGCKKCTLHYT